MKFTLKEMNGLLNGKCLPSDLIAGETLAVYLVREFSELEQRLIESERYGRQTDITIDNLEMKLAQMAAENAWLKQFPDQIVGFIGKRGGRPMSNIDKRALRKKLNRRLNDAFGFQRTSGGKHTTISLSIDECKSVLVALDELEAKDNRAVEMPTFDGYVPHIARELQAAFRIACDNAGIKVSAGTDEGDRA
ncbi:hypothetical protein B7D30_000588 [Enterobacter ludwigii]|nr:hypothetical protein [Enterobacter ludwigii]